MLMGLGDTDGVNNQPVTFGDTGSVNVTFGDTSGVNNQPVTFGDTGGVNNQPVTW